MGGDRDRKAEVAGTFSIRREGKLSTPQSVVVLEGNKAIVETLRTPYRYYFVPATTGLAGLLVSGVVSGAVGSAGLVWDLVGVVGGTLAGMAAILMIQDRRHSRLMSAIREGDREVSNDIVVKKGKVNLIEVDDESRGKVLHIVTPSDDFELSGDAEEVDRVYDALT